MTISPSLPKLFTPVQVGDLSLKHRVVLAPLTRFRADDEHVHTDMAVAHYAQRAAVPGTLLIAEGTIVSPQASGYANAPGIWNDTQVAAWKKVVDAVHANGSYIYLQIFALGRQGSPEDLKKEGPYPYVSASNIQLTGKLIAPRALTVDEIKQYVQDFATAAFNAVHGAGFDGIEIHGSNGYLVDQFLQDVSNKRTDEYGGSVENRARFALEITDAVIEKIGAKKTGFRVSPWSTFGDMRMEDPILTFTYLVEQLAQRDLAYFHAVEPRIAGDNNKGVVTTTDSNEFMAKIWSPRTLLRAGGYTRENAIEVAERTNDLIVFGRYYTSNPDLPLRLKKDLPLTPYDRNNFYAAKQVSGYLDYTYAPENEEELGKFEQRM